MESATRKSEVALAVALAGLMATLTVSAGTPPPWHGAEESYEREEKRAPGHERDEQVDGNERNDLRNDASRIGDPSGHFDRRRQNLVRDYYGERSRDGHCPDGLARKHGVCVSSDQARKWRIGLQLPHGVISYVVPHPLEEQLGQLPSRYRYVRVDSDILLITTGTRTVVEAILDLGRT